MSELLAHDDYMEVLANAHREVSLWFEGTGDYKDEETPMYVACFQELLRHMLTEMRAFPEAEGEG